MSDLSICVPTYNRPRLLERALLSVVRDVPPEVAERIEVVVSDNSADEASEGVVREVLVGWPGSSRYVRHEPNVGMVNNFNKCVELSRGRWVLILHDDDYLLPGAMDRLLAGVGSAGDDRVLLFGVRVTNAEGRLIRRQGPRSERRLPPRAALVRLLSNSSLVRFPAIVVRRDAYEAVGPFDATVGGATDVDMWRRLLGRYGVRLIPAVTTAYVVHPDAATEDVFNAHTIEAMEEIFRRAASQQVLAEDVVRRAQRHWLHQFILAGAFRRLRARDLEGARKIMSLFSLPDVRRVGPSPRWMPVRLAFTVLTRSVSPGR